jgi:tRNA pseudouridine38-40 synthase
MRTLRLVLEYDGTEYAGWQRQAGQRTVQACLEEAFFSMTAQTVKVRGSGRTDAGVHAQGQVASVEVDSRIPASQFLRGLNAHLPDDIAITDVADVAADFDARRSARGKVYRYLIWNHAIRSPRLARTTWHLRAPLDTHVMRQAASLLIGTHDFRGFRAADCTRLNTIRTMRRFDVDRQGALITMEVEGNAFLKNMVRIMVGTLVGIGRNTVSQTSIGEVLTSGNRAKAGVTAPPHGLSLARVIY